MYSVYTFCMDFLFAFKIAKFLHFLSWPTKPHCLMMMTVTDVVTHIYIPEMTKTMEKHTHTKLNRNKQKEQKKKEWKRNRKWKKPKMNVSRLTAAQIGWCCCVDVSFFFFKFMESGTYVTRNTHFISTLRDCVHFNGPQILCQKRQFENERTNQPNTNIMHTKME